MNSARDREIAIFNGALQLPPKERAAYLAMACAGDSDLCHRIELLLKANQEAAEFLEEARQLPAELPGPQGPKGTLAVAPSSTEKEGEMIGRYKVLQEIGEGGGGVVYMAQQEEPVRRRVALKVIKLGMDTRQVIARFEAERQALALMDHPNIAKVLDAGATETGRPFFVMELVRGIKITDYCDQNKLRTDERLKLFVQICHAVQHAHQKGIIHRDIKPSNILVTLHDGVPVPKVIDFGIAKATTDVQLTDKTMFTRFEQFIGTPAYMSPEQAEMSGLDIDTRTDVYSLGVLCYELLTGLTPFDAKELQAAGLEQMRRTIREKEPIRPSTRVGALKGDDLTTTAARRGVEAPKLISLLRGDLDWIAMKALEKDRTRRYETANALATDVEHYLKNEPIFARPPSKIYRFHKLVRRNIAAFAAAATVFVALVAGLGVSTWMFVQERAARQRALEAEKEQARLRQQADTARQKAEADDKRARTEAQKSQQVTKFLQQILKGVGPEVALGRDMNVVFREILEETAGRVDKDLRNRPEVAVELLTTLGDVYEALGEYVKAENMYREGLRIQEPLGSKEKVVGYLLNHLGLALWDRDLLAEAEVMQRKALALRTELFGELSAEVAESKNDLALVREHQRDMAGAEALFRESLAIRDKLPEPEKSAADNQKEIATTLSNLGQVLFYGGDLNGAETVQRRSLELRRHLFPKDSVQLAVSLNNLGLTLLDHSNVIEAEADLREALGIVRKVLPEQHLYVTLAARNLGVALRRRGASDADPAALREALELYPAEPFTADAFASLLAKPALNPLSAEPSSAGWRYTYTQPSADWASPDFPDREWPSTQALFGASHSWGRSLNKPPIITTRTNVWLRREFMLSEMPVGKLALRVNRNQDAQVFLNGLPAAVFADWSDSEIVMPCAQIGTSALKPGRNVLALFCQDADGGTRLDVGLYLSRDESLGRKQLLEEFNQLLEKQPKRAEIYIGRASTLARLGRWKDAAADLAKVVELKPGAEMNWWQLAPLLVETGDLVAYRSHRQKALARFARPDGPDQAGRVSQLALLIASEGSELAAAAKLADEAAAAEYRDAMLTRRQLAKGLAEYRQSHFMDSIGWTDKALTSCTQRDLPGWNHERERNRTATAHSLQAMAHHQLRHSQEAQASLSKATQVVQTQFPELGSGDLGREWQEWLIAHILLREAKALMEGRSNTAAESKR